MKILINKTTKRILNKDANLSNMIYRTLNDIEIFLDQAYFKGNLVLEGAENKFILTLNPMQYLNSTLLLDLHDQIRYLIKCNKELKYPLEIN
jgi:tyrosine-protein phosphatase YwqE